MSIKETAVGFLTILLILAAFMLAGSLDYHDEQVYRESWHQIHGVD